MGLTNFPNGASSFGIPVLGSGPILTTGNVFFVDSGSSGRRDAADHGTSPDTPFATIDYAIGRCTADNGDVILVMPGHTETIAAAAGIACDVAGVSIIGLGMGGARPTITWSATGSTWTVSAANVTIANIRCTVSVDEVVKLFVVSAANVTFDRVDFFETASAQAIQFMLTTAAADYLTIRNCVHRQLTAAGSAQVWIELVGTDHTRIIDNSIFIVANASTSSICISGSTTVIYAEIARNQIMWIGGTITKAIDLGSGTGVVSDNRIALSSTAGAITDVITATGAYKHQNFAIDAPAIGSTITPVAGSYT